MDDDATSFPLTTRERAVLAFIADHQKAHGGRSPSFRDIAHAVGLVAHTALYPTLRSLERRGYLSREPRRARSFEILQGPGAAVAAPPAAARARLTHAAARLQQQVGPLETSRTLVRLALGMLGAHRAERGRLM